MPRMSGKLESASGPEASTTVRALNRLRCLVVAVHTPVSSSKDRPLTSAPNRMRWSRAKWVAISSMCRHISDPDGYAVDQFGFLTNENEYSSDGISQEMPG